MGPQATRAQGEAARRERVLGEAWRANLDELAKDGKPDIVVFTGDLADWGHSTDYREGSAFLGDTCSHLKVPLDRLFLVPGNHDVQRGVGHDAWTFLRHVAAEDPDAVSKWLAGGDPPLAAVAKVDAVGRSAHERVAATEPLLRAVLDRSVAFWDAIERELGRGELRPTRSPHGRLGYRVTLVLPGLPRVHIIGLDSGWFAGGDNDATRLLITEDQVHRLATDESGRPLDGFRLGLVHHPLPEIDGRDGARRELRDRVDLLLRGHQHTPLATTLVDPDHSLHELAAGCLFEGNAANRHPNGHQLIDVEFSGEVPVAQVRFRSWSPHGNFWFNDASLYRHTPEGQLRFELAASARTKGAPPNDQPTKTARTSAIAHIARPDDQPPRTVRMSVLTRIIVPTLASACMQLLDALTDSDNGAVAKDATFRIDQECEGQRPLANYACALRSRQLLRSPAGHSSDQRAFRLAKKACDSTDTLAMAVGCTTLGELTADGRGTPKDPAAAVTLFERACSLQNARSCNCLGEFAERGVGVAKDVKRAKELFSKACDWHNADACKNLGRLYRAGVGGVVRDYTKAAQLMDRACSANNAEACYLEAEMVYTGEARASDHAESARLRRRACDLKAAAACVAVAVQYEAGDGVSKNAASATAYRSRACDLGLTTECAPP